MRMNRLGDSGLYVSEMCLGTMTFGGNSGLWGQVGKLGQDEADTLVKAALDIGINFIDTANIYADGRSEEILGQALKNLGLARDALVIATKVAGPMGETQNQRGASRRHILEQCKASLKRLGTDYIDLYQIHEFDPATPIEETLEALDGLVRAGDVRYIGLSNWAAWQVMKALGIARARNLAPIISLQAYYSLAGRDLERELSPMLLSERVGLTVWSPLAGGYLTGKYSGDGDHSTGRRTTLNFPPIDEARSVGVVEVLRTISRRHDCSMGEVALAWLLKQPVVSSVIIGAKHVDQLYENARATGLKLGDEDMLELDAASRIPAEYPGWALKRPSDRHPP